VRYAVSVKVDNQYDKAFISSSHLLMAISFSLFIELLNIVNGLMMLATTKGIESIYYSFGNRSKKHTKSFTFIHLKFSKLFTFVLKSRGMRVVEH
jgi:hypothetical protein